VPAALLLAAAIAFAAGGVRADDVLHPGTVGVDRPTVVTLGVQLLVTGDDEGAGRRLGPTRSTSRRRDASPSASRSARIGRGALRRRAPSTP